jgi:hypothetical protein
MAPGDDAEAAESFDNCTGFIISLPTVINSQGTWCLKQDLATAITSGNAITINNNNVTLDCNNFKLGGLAAGLGTTTVGVRAIDRVNATVRHCSIRGFFDGIYFSGTASGGHVIEDNRFDGNTYSGIYVVGDGSVLRRNRVLDTGGSTVASDTTAIWTVDSVDVIDNTVSNAVAGGVSNAFGIYTSNNVSGRVIGNGVRGVVRTAPGVAFGILNASSDRITLRDNDLVGDGSAGSTGITCQSANGRAKDNVINGFVNGIDTCSNDGGNVIAP